MFFFRRRCRYVSFASAKISRRRIKLKKDTLVVILLTEYHASSIRLWRVVLLRSGIRLSPSDIRRSLRERCELLWRIEYHCEAKPNNITARRAISLFAKQRISLIKMQKRESFTELYFRITLSSVFIASFALLNKYIGLCPYPY